MHKSQGFEELNVIPLSSVSSRLFQLGFLLSSQISSAAIKNASPKLKKTCPSSSSTSCTCT
ncbi:hypothetical protein PanWU01x14_064250 [Parasponia andersonii]|uniref:Uncharacterized protein n=1 Tax=Parasponia andersonii TaxID=3476 RepID=A0A2P5DH77_PARAD|nr:hypothetical protein PanWU01x14_064250 [Parasponia andersonii]